MSRGGVAVRAHGGGDGDGARRGMATPTPMPGGEGTLAAVMPRSPSPTPAEAGTSAAETPVLIFLYFHKAIRAELEALHGAAVRLATERSGDVAALAERCRFFFNIYKHHCDAEDAVRMLAARAGLRFCVFVHFSLLLHVGWWPGGGLELWWIWAWMRVVWGGHGCENFGDIGFRVAELLPLFGCTWCDGD